MDKSGTKRKLQDNNKQHYTNIQRVSDDREDRVSLSFFFLEITKVSYRIIKKAARIRAKP